MDKIKDLQDLMRTKGLTGLLVPHNDEFQGEYIGPHSERLKWLTGFTGSAGFVVLTLDKVAFFTDSRYTLHAKREIPDSFEFYNIASKTPASWIKETFPQNAKVGYDPWLFTEVQLQPFTCDLIPLTPNLIDGLWKDRPLPPKDFIKLHPLHFTGESDESKRYRVGQTLHADNTLITACDSIAWLLNIRGKDVPEVPIVHSICLLRKDGSYDLFVDLDKATAEIYTHVTAGKGRLIKISQIEHHLNQLNGACQFDPTTTPVALVHILNDAGIPLVRAQDPCLLPKAIKNDVELKGATHAQIQDGKALIRFFEWLKSQPLEGETTEFSAGEKLYEFRKQGEHFKGISFDTISGFGPHGAIIHYKATPESDSPLLKNNLYLIDSGGQYLTGTTDITRTLSLGKPTSEQKELYTRVLKGHIALAMAIFPKGTTGAQLDTLARQFLWEVGQDYEHGTGHGVGSYLNVHEGPQGISRRGANAPLQPGMILSNEPGCYKEGEFGIRIENEIQVIELENPKGYLGFETITLVPLETELIEESLLTDKEKAWIDAYHQKIKTLLFPS